MEMKKRIIISVFIGIIVITVFFFIAGKLRKGDNQVAEYTSITMDEAKEIFKISFFYLKNSLKII